MTKGKNKGYLIPEVPQPDENICICVPVPKDWGHINAFLGQIMELGYWYMWEKDDDHNGRLAAEPWRKILDCISEEINCAMANDCGCGSSDTQFIYRHNPTTDRLERSSDGGITWENDPADPRYNSPVFAPQEGDTPSDVRCLSATNAVVYYKTQLVDQASEWTTLTTVIAGIIAVLIGLLTGGIGAALVIELASTWVNVGIAAAVAAMSTEVLDRFKCNLYCNSLPDGSWDEASLVAIKAQIDIDETATANTLLKSWIDQLGTVGLTNSGRTKLENDADCSDCGCFSSCEEPDQLFYLGTVNSVVTNTDGTITVDIDSADDGAGTQAIKWGDDPTFAKCCCFIEATVTNPVGPTNFGENPCEGGHFDSAVFVPGDIAALTVFQNGAYSTPFNMLITFGGDACE
jgi:hypothetical protein